jgi:hypothetical protein
MYSHQPAQTTDSGVFGATPLQRMPWYPALGSGILELLPVQPPDFGTPVTTASDRSDGELWDTFQRFTDNQINANCTGSVMVRKRRLRLAHMTLM